MSRKVENDRSEKRTDGRPAQGRRKAAEGQPRPRLPLFSGKDSTLAERFEEELYGRKDD
jgi:hypothetical protein